MSALTAALFGSQALLAGGAAYSQAQALKQQGEFEKSRFETNSRMADMQAEDAIRRGEKSVAQHKQSVKKLIGSQRVALAAQGLDVDDGSAADVQDDTAALGALDELTIRNNAWREAFGYRVQANDLRGQGNQAHAAAKNKARDTLLTGGLQALGYGGQAMRKGGY